MPRAGSRGAVWQSGKLELAEQKWGGLVAGGGWEHTWQGHSRRKERAVWPEGGGRASPETGNAGHGLMYQELGGSVSPVGRDLFDKP